MPEKIISFIYKYRAIERFIKNVYNYSAKDGNSCTSNNFIDIDYFKKIFCQF